MNYITVQYDIRCNFLVVDIELPKTGIFERKGLRIFQHNGLKLDKDLTFSGLVQNVYVYRMAKSKKIWPFRFYAMKF